MGVSLTVDTIDWALSKGNTVIVQGELQVRMAGFFMCYAENDCKTRSLQKKCNTVILQGELQVRTAGFVYDVVSDGLCFCFGMCCWLARYEELLLVSWSGQRQRRCWHSAYRSCAAVSYMVRV
jgi:hypothetical protein